MRFSREKVRQEDGFCGLQDGTVFNKGNARKHTHKLRKYVICNAWTQKNADMCQQLEAFRFRLSLSAKAADAHLENEGLTQPCNLTRTRMQQHLLASCS
jgi:hypothetical protein